MDDTYQQGLEQRGDAPQSAPAQEPYSFEDYDRIWQRVLPELNTFPESRNEEGELPGTPVPGDQSLMSLPGAQRDPCCMGSAAQQSIGVITGFAETEIALCRFYRSFLRKAPNPRAARSLRQLLDMEIDHVRRLRAIYYLITGACMQTSRQIIIPPITTYCDTLRTAYHEEACGSFNYYRAAVGAPDPCLRALFERLGGTKRTQSETLVNLLGAAMC